MTIILVGLNHRTAPVELREKLALTPCTQQMVFEALNRQLSLGKIDEVAILSTCNRLEIYATADDSIAGWQSIEEFLARLQNIQSAELKPHLYFLEDDPAIEHLMHVACGLDSMILGEPQILGQVTQAYQDAQNAHLTGAVLSHLFMQAIHIGKRARTETDISRHTTSISHAGALLIAEKTHQSGKRNILVVGAGEMAQLAAQSLKNLGIHTLRFINRTYSHAEDLAQKFEGTAISWYQLDEALQWADIVITATGAPHTVIYKDDVEHIIAKRDERPLILVDIAVPRDIDVAVEELVNVQRYDIDHLQSIVDANTAQREAEIPSVKALIAEEMSEFHQWHNSRRVTPVIQNLRAWAQDVAQSEVEQALNRMQDADAQTIETVKRLAHRLVNKLLHEPTVRLREHASGGNGIGYAYALTELFGLENQICTPDTQSCISNGHENGSHSSHSDRHAPYSNTTAPCDLQCIIKH